MAYRAALATGNFNTAATWLQGTNVPTIHASTNTSLSTTPVYSATLTAPNITNASVGCMVYLVAKGTATTITATLQESTVDTAHTVTINLANVNAGTWIFFKPATPYTFTTLLANRYRWKFVVDTGTTTTLAQASTANPACIYYDNRAVVPVSGDYVYIVGENGSTTIDVTLDGTQTIGNNVTSGVARSITNALYLSNSGKLTGDTTASHQLTHRGTVYVDVAGEINVGTVASPLSSSYTSTFIAGTDQGGFTYSDGGKSVLQGTPKLTSWKALYVSGVGTAADPMITDGDIGVVGDEVLIGASSDDAANYNQTESRFIITKNSATSYVISATSGGAEAALTYTHPNAQIANVQRNIIIKGTSAAVRTYFMPVNQTATGNIDVDWVRFQAIATGTFFGAVATQYVAIANNVAIDYSVVYGFETVAAAITGNTAQTITGLVTYSTLTPTFTSAVAFAAIYISLTSNKTLVDCFSMGYGSYGMTLENTYSCTFTNCKVMGGGSVGTGTLSGLAISSSGKNQFTGCDFGANRLRGIYYVSGALNTFTECNLGTNGVNTTDITMGTGFCSALFEDCNFGSATLIASYSSMILGSEIKFQRFNDTDNVHRWYVPEGYGMTEDTVVRSPGLSVKLVPENLSTGLTWSFQIPVAQYSVARFLGYFLKNATLGTGVATVSMYLPGNPVGGGSPDATITLSNTTGSSFNVTDEQAISLTANYTGAIPGVATVLVNVKSNTSGAYLYADDFFNAGDRTTTFDSVTGLNTWIDGKPIGVISPLVPSAADTAAAVWGAGASTNNTSGTMGRLQNKALSVSKFLGLK